MGATWTGWGRKARGLPTGLCSATQHPPLPPSELEPALLTVNTVWILEAGLLRKFLCVLHTCVHMHRCPQRGPVAEGRARLRPVQVHECSGSGLACFPCRRLRRRYPAVLWVSGCPAAARMGLLPIQAAGGASRLPPARPASAPGQAISAESAATLLLRHPASSGLCSPLAHPGHQGHL